VGRSNLKGSGTKFRINILVENYIYSTVNNWYNNLLSLKVFISVVVRINTNSSISKNSFRPCCSYYQIFLAANYLVFTKGLGPSLMLGDILFLACCIPVLWAISIAGLRKQER
jgi:hypothetical protein